MARDSPSGAGRRGCQGGVVLAETRAVDGPWPVTGDVTGLACQIWASRRVWVVVRVTRVATMAVYAVICGSASQEGHVPLITLYAKALLSPIRAFTAKRPAPA